MKFPIKQEWKAPFMRKRSSYDFVYTKESLSHEIIDWLTETNTFWSLSIDEHGEIIPGMFVGPERRNLRQTCPVIVIEDNDQAMLFKLTFC